LQVRYPTLSLLVIVLSILAVTLAGRYLWGLTTVLTNQYRQKRIKCDQNQPSCKRCNKANSPCHYNLLAPPVQLFRGFKHSFYSSDFQKNHATIEEYSSNGIEYFCLKALPVWRSSHPSTLWDHMVASLVQRTSSLCHIAAAVGIQQRIVDRCSISTQARSQADELYSRAIKSLRQSMLKSSNVDGHVLPCVLMVVLEFLRGSTSRLLIHLRCGLRLLTEKTETGCQDTREAANMLQQYAVRAMMFNPLSKDARCLQATLTSLLRKELAESTVETTSNPIFALSTSITALMSLLEEHYRTSPSLILEQLDSTGKLPTRIREALSCLEQRRNAIEQVVDARLALAHGVHRVQTAVFNITKACCVLVKIYLSSAWTGRQSSYDDKIDSFQEIVKLINATLDLLNTVDGKEVVSNSTPFFVGFSLQTILMMVFLNCRCPEVRQQVFALLKKCPHQEGQSEVTAVEAICRVISEFEQRAAGGTGGFVPESCRVHRYLILPAEHTSGTPQVVRLYFRPVEGNELKHHEARLSVE